MLIAVVASVVPVSQSLANPPNPSGPLTFTGKLTGEVAATSLLIVADDGTAVRATPDAKGSFSVAVPAELTGSYRRDNGASVQVVRYGYHVGPVGLGGAKVWRLATKLPSVVDLGTVRVTDKGGSATTSSRLTDRRSLRLKTTFSRSMLTDRRDIWASVGGDVDNDGLPNLFDRDSDGNGVPDGAQLSLDWKVDAKNVSKLNSKNVMTRSFFAPQLEARFREDFRTSTPVNTNVNPSATLEQLQAYQDSASQVSMGSQIVAGRSVFFDCAGNYFCTEDGIVPVVPDQGNPKGDYGHFETALVLQGSGRLVPDGLTGILIEKKGSSVVSQRAAVIRSSIASPAILVSAGGVKQKYPLTAETTSIGGASFGNLTFEFYRPQELQTKPSLFMADRGGFMYRVVVYGNNGVLACKADNMQWSKQLIPISNDWDKGKNGQYLFDYDAKPKNGELLSITIDFWGCLKNPSEGATQPTSGQNATIAIEANDWANNRATIQFPFIMP